MTLRVSFTEQLRADMVHLSTPPTRVRQLNDILKNLALAVLRGCTRRHSKSRSSNPCAAIVFSDVRPVISKNTVDSGS